MLECVEYLKLQIQPAQSSIWQTQHGQPGTFKFVDTDYLVDDTDKNIQFITDENGSVCIEGLSNNSTIEVGSNSNSSIPSGNNDSIIGGGYNGQDGYVDESFNGSFEWQWNFDSIRQSLHDY